MKSTAPAFIAHTASGTSRVLRRHTLHYPRDAAEELESGYAALVGGALDQVEVDLVPPLPVSTRKKDRRNPFSTEQLGRIFGPASPLYRPETPLGGRGGRFWVPLLSLWSGMRLNECCQLKIDDVRYVPEIPIIVIAEDLQGGGDEADAKRVKTEAGERFVPVHTEVQRLGFLRHWQAIEEGRPTPPLPGPYPRRDGYYSDPFSKWFSRSLKSVAAYTRKTTFHSLRHNYRDALRNTEMSGEMVRALGAGPMAAMPVMTSSGFTPERLNGAIQAVRYAGLDL